MGRSIYNTKRTANRLIYYTTSSFQIHPHRSSLCVASSLSPRSLLFYLTPGGARIRYVTIFEHDTPTTYDVNFFGTCILTTVTCQPHIVTDWISEVEELTSESPPIIVGIDVKYRRPSRRYKQKLAATLQLCVGSRCLIYQLIHSPHIPPSLIYFLMNRSYKFVGAGMKEHLENLQQDYEFGYHTNAVDLWELAGENGKGYLSGRGLTMMAAAVLHRDVKTPKKVSLWANEWLAHRQIKYAAVTAFVAFEIGRRFLEATVTKTASVSPQPTKVEQKTDVGPQPFKVEKKTVMGASTHAYSTDTAHISQDKAASDLSIPDTANLSKET